MSRVLICGEGKTDVGIRDYQTSNWLDGPATIILKRNINPTHSVEGISYKELKRHKVLKLKSSGHGMKSERLAKYAAKNAFDIAVCYVDCDKNYFAGLRALILSGFSNSGASVKGVAMIPKSMIECWLMADPHSYQTVFGRIPDNPGLPSNPESVWGRKDDPTSNYPKRYLERIVGQYSRNPSHWMIMLAENCLLDELREKCKISYKTFHEDIQRI